MSNLTPLLFIQQNQFKFNLVFASEEFQSTETLTLLKVLNHAGFETHFASNLAKSFFQTHAQDE